MSDQSALKNINEALLLLQAERIVLRKDREGQVGQQKTKYADLVQANEVILARLFALGVLWKTLPTLRVFGGPNGQEDPRFVLEWELLHVASDTKVSGTYPLPAGANPMQNGSAISYARRYALVAATNAVADDDDDDGQGYRGRQGMARRAAVRQERTQPTAPRAERAQPAQAPELPAPTSPAAASNEPHRGRGGLITEPMTRKLAITMKEVVGDDPADRKAFIVDMIGREVASSKELTFDEGRGLIDAFEKAKATDNPIGTVIDIYRRTTGAGSPAQQRPETPDVDAELTEAIRTGQWRTVRFYANDPGGYGPNIDAAKGALAGAGYPRGNWPTEQAPEERGGAAPDEPQEQARLRSSVAAAKTRTQRTLDAITNGGDEGAEPAPWEGEIPL